MTEHVVDTAGTQAVQPPTPQPGPWQRLRHPPFTVKNLLSDLLAITSVLGLAWKFDLITPYLYLFLAAYALMTGYWFWRFRRVEGKDQVRLVRALARNGRRLVAVLYALVGLYTLLRFHQAAERAAIAIGWGVLGWLIIRPLITEGARTEKLMMRSFTIGSSILVAWTIASLAYDPLSFWISPRQNRAPNPTVYEEREQLRQAEAPDVTIAVALSGGGYRAAAIHTGVLKALEAHRIPIHYLSTVSGGSIIGAYYAMGHTPQEFAELLSRKKPGLPNDLFHLWNLLGALVVPGRSDSDTYARHLAHLYFGDARLNQIKTPTLLVNVTDYVSGEREVFSSDPASGTADVRLADAVAASGAFPGAFEPKQVGDRHYMDGGVVENLGLEGLRQFLLSDSTPAKPDILIVSDASKGDKDPDPGEKRFRFQLLKDASSASYQALHLHLYRIYTDTSYHPEDERSLVQPYFQHHSHIYGIVGKHDDHLFVFVLNGTSQAERRYMERRGEEAAAKGLPPEDGSVINGHTAETVANIATLSELTRTQVIQGVWVGETIATKYADAIRCTLQHLRRARLEKKMIDPEKVRTDCGTDTLQP